MPKTKSPKKSKLSKFGLYLKKLSKKEISTWAVAADLEITPSYVNALALGTMTPGLKLAVKIQKWSKGAVPATSWVKA